MEYCEKVFELSKRMRLLSLNEKSIIVQAKYGPSKAVKIPLIINHNLSCFVAAVIGDGHLSKEKFRITIESSNKELLEILSQMTNKLFYVNSSIKEIKKRERKKQTYHLSIYSKAIQELLSNVFSIPRGKKSDIAKIPTEILNADNQVKSAFVVGILAAEGSKKGKNKVRICSASKKLLEDTKNILRDLEIQSSIESWINQKYKKEYYSLSFKRIYLDSLMRECRSGQTGMILSIFKKATEYQA